MGKSAVDDVEAAMVAAGGAGGSRKREKKGKGLGEGTKGGWRGVGGLPGPMEALVVTGGAAAGLGSKGWR